MERTHTVKMAAIAEAVLFGCGEPVPLERLAEVMGADIKELPDIIECLNKRYEEAESSLRAKLLGKSYQLCTEKEFAPYIRAAMENKKGAALSNAAMEVLTIVAYNQPVTKSFIEHVRGIDSSSVVNNLVERELLEEAGRLEIPGRPVAYRTTENFLRCFELSSLGDLPPLPILQPEKLSKDSGENTEPQTPQ